jgi:hypothetical protein
MRKVKEKFSKIICLLLVALFLFPSSAFADITSQYEAQQLRETVMQYVTVSQDMIITFDETEAVANGENAMVIEVGNKLVEIADSYYLYNNGITTYIPNIPIYGNYCGPGNPLDNGRPIDHLDAACQAHDDCYATNGYWDCNCDEKLIADVNDLMDDLTGTAYIAGNGIIAFFEARGFFGC